MTSSSSASLRYDVFTIRRPGLSRDVPGGDPALQWVANSATLISGEHDAVLVDTFLTEPQTKMLADWIAASGKHLKAIYITHGHGDHFFGIGALQKRFPEAKAYAIPDVVEAMHHQSAPEMLDGFWRKLFPGEIAETMAVADVLEAPELELEGHKLVPIDAGHTDMSHSTALHVPSIGLIVGGDVVYNGIHCYLGETTRESREHWITTLDRLKDLKPSAVVAGHKIPENGDDPAIIEETQQYLRDFNRLELETKTARELFDAMLALHPLRANPGSLWGAAKITKGA
jgi:glyoxylase-like metal-dependent hydrolase (beta-lactamase superfamily II)